MIHKYRFKDLNIVIDTDSGSIHTVDDVVYRILDFYKSIPEATIIDILKQEFCENEIRSGIEEIKSLEDQGELFYEMQAPQGSYEPVMKALCLHVAHDCNLRCGYCFASTGDFKGDRGLMPEGVGRKALDFILNESKKRKYIEVDFFGGEPMMNFPVVKKLIQYGRQQSSQMGKTIRFTMTTNATVMPDDVLDFLNRENISLVLSIDGRPEVNDRMRKTINGKGTYDVIMKNIKRIIDSRENENYYLRGTFTHYNTDFSKDVMHLAGMGYKHVSVEPVVADENRPYAFRSEDITKIYEEYEILTDEIYKRIRQGKDLNFFHFNIDPENGPCAHKRSSGCGAGIEYCAVTPTGEIYPCHQFVGDTDFIMGNVYDGVTNHKVEQMFKNASLFNKPECVKCWAKYYCGGGCHANAYNFNKDLKKPYTIGCDMERKRVECAIYLYIKKAELSRG